jgi:hypothetical protein
MSESIAFKISFEYFFGIQYLLKKTTTNKQTNKNREVKSSPNVLFLPVSKARRTFYGF